MTGAIEDVVRTAVSSSSLVGLPYAVAVRASDGTMLDLSAGSIGLDVEVTPDTVMYAASLAKQVVGLLAAQLVVAGRLQPDDAITEHLDGLPEWARRIRLRHLVNHTSGLHDEPLLAGATGNAGVLARLRAVPEPAAAPGVAYRYSNLGYICLGEAVTRVSREPLTELSSRLFESLGMHSARLGGAAPAQLVGQASPPATVGDGGLWLSARDLRLWNDTMNARALGAAVHELAETPGALDDGSPLDYAWGVRVFDHAGRRTISHGGSWPTWSAKAVRQPDAGTSVAILTTVDDADGITALALELTCGIAD